MGLFVKSVGTLILRGKVRKLFASEKLHKASFIIQL